MSVREVDLVVAAVDAEADGVAGGQVDGRSIEIVDEGHHAALCHTYMLPAVPPAWVVQPVESQTLT